MHTDTMGKFFEKYDVFKVLEETMTNCCKVEDLLHGIIALAVDKDNEALNSPSLIQERLCILLKTASSHPKFGRFIHSIMKGIFQLSGCIDGRILILESNKISRAVGASLSKSREQSLYTHGYSEEKKKVLEKEIYDLVFRVKIIFLTFSRSHYEKDLLPQEKMRQTWRNHSFNHGSNRSPAFAIPMDQTNQTKGWGELIELYDT
jgi:hypothetical protein